MTFYNPINKSIVSMAPLKRGSKMKRLKAERKRMVGAKEWLREEMERQQKVENRIKARILKEAKTTKLVDEARRLDPNYVKALKDGIFPRVAMGSGPPLQDSHSKFLGGGGGTGRRNNG